MDHIVSITHWIWYLTDKNKERVKIQNLLQELIQKQIRGVRTPSRTVSTQ